MALNDLLFLHTNFVLSFHSDADMKPLLFMCEDATEILSLFGRSKGWTTIIFQILFVAQCHSMLSE